MRASRWQIRRTWSIDSADLEVCHARFRPTSWPKHCNGTTTGWSTAVALMAFGGLRCGEVSRLAVGDIDLVRSVIYVVGKGGHTRWVPIVTPMRPHLYALDGASPAAPVFPRADGNPGPSRPARISQLVGECLRKVSGRQFSAHQLRHHYAGEVLTRSGGKLELVQHSPSVMRRSPHHPESTPNCPKRPRLSAISGDPTATLSTAKSKRFSRGPRHKGPTSTERAKSCGDPNPQILISRRRRRRAVGGGVAEAHGG